MGRFGDILARLRKEEQHLEKQLKGIRTAISSLEFGTGGGVPRTSFRKGSAARKKRAKR